MPKCLDCGNTKRIWYTEVCHKLGIYNDEGEFIDVETDNYEEVQTSSGECAECGGKRIEGKL
jgi:hypothetical protein